MYKVYKFVVVTSDERGNKLCKGQYNVFIVGSGNFGGKRSSSHEKLTKPVPKRPPCAITEQETRENQVIHTVVQLCGLKWSAVYCKVYY